MAPTLSLYGNPCSTRLSALIDDKNKELIPLEKRLRQIAEDIQMDRFMLMEYLGPVVDGCRAAFNVSLDRAQTLDDITDPEFESYMSTTDDSYRDIGFCFKTTDTDEHVSLVFSHGKPEVFDECIEPNVIILGELETLLTSLDADSKISPPDLLGSKIEIKGEDSLDVVQGLGLLCYPSLLRIARSGIDPSSLLSEDADTIIMAAASDLVVKMIRKWIDIQITSDD
ncbi:MAG: hypothetical protein E4H14_01515 [Candidatus Thorarchaeota archaeon]|nr:MAG: hypothetical protein E4H14_01515 [Candidatus Thorarchaeota archaeon]